MIVFVKLLFLNICFCIFLNNKNDVDDEQLTSGINWYQNAFQMYPFAISMALYTQLYSVHRMNFIINLGEKLNVFNVFFVHTYFSHCLICSQDCQARFLALRFVLHVR